MKERDWAHHLLCSIDSVALRRTLIAMCALVVGGYSIRRLTRSGAALSRLWTTTQQQMATEGGASAGRRPTRLELIRAAQPPRNVVVDGPNDIEKELPEGIVEMHRTACKKNERWYMDPASGLMVTTRVAHIERGRCCGNRCRHCPYGHINVPLSAKPTNSNSSNKSTSAAPSTAQPSDIRCSPSTPPNAATSHTASVYTRTGDGGESSLFTGERRPKSDPVFEALGSVDELNSFIGLAIHSVRLAIATLPRGGDAFTTASTIEPVLCGIQRKLLDAGSIIATPDPAAPILALYDPEQWTRDLESIIDRLDSTLPPLTEFILPGGSLAACQLHVCRSVCRRAERALVDLLEAPARRPQPTSSEPSRLPATLKYVNRLSDFFFIAARCFAEDERRYTTTG